MVGFGHRRRYLSDAIAIVILVCSAAIVLLPFAWIVSTAFKTPLDGTALPPLIVFKPTLENLDFLTSGPFPQYEINSVILTVMATVLALAFGVPAGYALSLSRGNRGARFL